MMRAMHTSATGMYGQELFIDMIANNLANVNTTAFKKTRIEFQDLLYQTLLASGTNTNSNTNSPVECQIGTGARPVSIQKIFSQGALVPTYNALDCAIQGTGFFQVLQLDGTIGYTRDGTFKLSADGKLVTSDGLPMEPGIIIPADANEISIAADGTLSVTILGETEPEEIGQIELARFINPAALTNVGQNLYRPNQNTGEPILGTPGIDGFGVLTQGSIENSNVEVVEEMVNMIAAQRAYEINSKSIKAADEMLQTANNLVR